MRKHARALHARCASFLFGTLARLVDGVAPRGAREIVICFAASTTPYCGPSNTRVEVRLLTDKRALRRPQHAPRRVVALLAARLPARCGPVALVFGFCFC